MTDKKDIEMHFSFPDTENESLLKQLGKNILKMSYLKLNSLDDSDILIWQNEHNKKMEEFKNIVAIMHNLPKTIRSVKEMKEEKIKNEIYDKVKIIGKKVTKKTLLDMGYTQRQLRTINIKLMNFELFDLSTDK